MKIATYNVNGINARLNVLVRWLKEESPDIVCLQELKTPQEKFPESLLLDLGYASIWHGQKSWNGVAILSKVGLPLEVRRFLPGGEEDMHNRYLEAAINGMVIGCLYTPNGNPAPGPKFDYKLVWIKRLIAHAQTLVNLNAPVILVGDYNVIPTNKDVYKPERWIGEALFRPEVKEAFEVLKSQGWTDAIREQHPDDDIYTFWDYFRNVFKRNAGLRIDHLLLNKKANTRLLDSGVDVHVRGWEKSSDHAPVWISLK
ncbi:MAG: exodeoxyribonuclease III [Cellvibrio sp.]|uniref:exodeoxyribonuclease III n=1 Tax=Cellvibrio sp. TaxID=1965322 RepID=UPI0031A2A972